MGIAVIYFLFFQGHGLASGEKAELLVQFGQADAGGLVSVVFQRLETWPSGLRIGLNVNVAVPETRRFLKSGVTSRSNCPMSTARSGA